MAGKIPQHFIDEVLARTDIVALIDARVPLKKAGKEYVARCPFHDEKTPSFTVSPSKQFYHCFGCGAHGSAIGFLMEYDHLSFPEAVEELARQAGLPMPREHTPLSQPQKWESTHRLSALHAILERAARHYQIQLRRHPQRDRAVNYLKGRGISGEIAKRFELGYAPPGWHHLEEALGRGPAERALLQEAGLLTQREDGQSYDRFRDRIMFPIRDHRGRLVGFGGRLIDGDGPKYLNSPETPVFHKGEELYGLHQARQQRSLERLLVVEGYMDVIALAQHGIPYAVATLGTALTEQHLQRLYRHVDEIILCFDGDRAGREAAWRAVETLTPFLDDRRSARFAFLPQGEDPDSLIRRLGREAFEEQIARSLTFSDFLLESLTQGSDMRSTDGHARLIQKARPYLQRLPEGARREELLNRLAGRVQWSPQELARRLELPQRQRNSSRNERRGQRRPPSLIARIIAMLLQAPELAQRAGDPERLARLELPGSGLLQELIQILQQRPQTTLAMLFEHWRGRPEGQYLARIQRLIPPMEEGALVVEFQDAMERIERLIVESEVESLLKKSQNQGLSPEEKRHLQALLQAQRQG